MKKILSIALIAALVAVSAFAVDISGEAALGFEYDLDAKSFGFGNTGSMNSVKFAFGKEFFNQSVEKKGEGDVYAVIKASLVIDWSAESTTPLFTSNPTADPDDGDLAWKSFGYDGVKGEFKPFKEGKDSFGVTAEISEAYITNDVWKLNILGSKAASDYAVSALDSWEDAKKKVHYVSAVAFGFPEGISALPGFVFEMGGYTASFGAMSNDTVTVFNAFAETAEYDIEGVKVQASIATLDQVAEERAYVNVVGSAKASYKTDTIDVSAAADISIADDNTGDDKDAKFNFDAAAKAVAYGVTADAYFALDARDVEDYKYHNENLLSAKVAYKTVIEGVEADVAFTGLDLINTQDLAASVTAEYGKVSGTVYAGYIVDKETWKAGASATYEEALYTVTGSVDAEEDVLKIAAGISSETLVAGAKLEAKYASGNLLADEAEYGKITAKATIAF